MNQPNDKELVELCLSELKKQMGYAEYAHLSQRDLEHLSEAIEAKTRILISLSTLKRILNGQFDRLPQTSTLNALTLYIGYEGWHDFKTRKLREQPVYTGSATEPVESALKNRSVWIITSLLMLTIAIAFVLKTPLLGSQNRAVEVQFSARQTSRQRLPNSVVFSYDVSKMEGDSFYFQQSWNEKTRVSIRKDNHTLTDIYYEPGYHRAKLMAGGIVLKEAGVSITSKDWFCYSKTDFSTLKPDYLNQGDEIHDGVLGITDKTLEASNIDFSKDQVYFCTFYPEQVEGHGDNFRYKARFRLRKINHTHCPWVMTEVFCEKSFLFFTNTISGCISDINAKVSENYLSGKTSDLSAFGCDVTQWQEIEIVSVNKNVMVYLAGKKIFEKPYNQSLGRIAGIGFASNGLIEVDSVSLSDLKGKIIYENGF